MSDLSLLPAALCFAVALASGAGVAWARPELDLRPGYAARDAALASLPAAVAVSLLGGVGAGWAFGLAFAAAAIDWRRRILPNEITYLLIASGLAAAAFAAPGEIAARALGAALGYGSLWALGWLWRRYRGEEAMGLGDAKLFAGLGAWLGWTSLAEIAFLAACFGVALGLARGREREIPFGPPLALGALVFWVVGPILTI